MPPIVSRWSRPAKSGDLRPGDLRPGAGRLPGLPGAAPGHGPAPAAVPEGVATRLGLFVDVETTGLDPQTDEIIELAMLPFIYGLDGQVYGAHPPFSELRQPARPIPPEVTRLTGLDDAAVAGRSIDAEAVRAFIAPAALVVAHNAAFDRVFLEAFCDAFAAKPWACSLSQVAWSEGLRGRQARPSGDAGRGGSSTATGRSMTARRRWSC